MCVLDIFKKKLYLNKNIRCFWLMLMYCKTWHPLMINTFMIASKFKLKSMSNSFLKTVIQNCDFWTQYWLKFVNNEIKMLT